MNLTWSQVMPIYIDSLQNGNDAQKEIAVEELTRLAQLVDEENKK